MDKLAREMDKRTATILEAAVRDFIETGVPVSSGSLYERYGFDVKPATIRSELNRLTGEDFLTQPHTSGGRVPTDKGYRFLVECIFEQSGTRRKQTAVRARSVTALMDELADGDFADFVSELADEVRSLSVGYGMRGQNVYKSGLHDLFDELASENAIEDLREISRIADDFEHVDERMHDLVNVLGAVERSAVFIGKSPITTSSFLSVVANSFPCRGERFVVAVVGPKRMDYEGTIALLEQMRKEMENGKMALGTRD